MLVVRLQLYREVCVIVILLLASYIDTTVLADGTYEMIPESEGGDQEAQLNASTQTECNTQFIKGHKPSNHIRARIKSHVYSTG